MFKPANIIKLVLLVAAIGSFTGCSELNELRGLNKRQAITIRDQGTEITNLKGENSRLSDRLLADEDEKKRLRAELEKLASAIGDGAVVRDTIEGPVIQLEEKILFDSGMAEIKTSGEAALLKMAEYMKGKVASSMRIDGHTDSDPILKTKHMWDSNHHLSAARALAVFHFLTKRENIPEKMIHISGFGPNRPVTENNTKEDKKKNRRVEFLIVKWTGGE